MQNVSERIRIEKVLRIVRAPDVTCPEKVLPARTPPSATLIAELKNSKPQNGEDDQPWRYRGDSQFGKGCFVHPGDLERFFRYAACLDQAGQSESCGVIRVSFANE